MTELHMNSTCLTSAVLRFHSVYRCTTQVLGRLHLSIGAGMFQPSAATLPRIGPDFSSHKSGVVSKTAEAFH
jgi:hypothetical protein